MFPVRFCMQRDRPHIPSQHMPAISLPSRKPMTLYRNSTVCLFRCERPDLRNHRTRRTATEYERRSYGAGATGAGVDQSCAKQSGAKWRDPRLGEQRGIRLMPGAIPPPLPDTGPRSHRPRCGERKSDFLAVGHWQFGTMMGERLREGSDGILTLIERTRAYVLIGKLSARAVAEANRAGDDDHGEQRNRLPLVCKGRGSEPGEVRFCYASS